MTFVPSETLSTKRDYFPPIEPFEKGRLKVSELHELYYEQSGNPTGRPIIFLHGGPGGGTTADHRRFYDPAHYRIILLDQRGSGQSTPSAELRENTTWDLINDIEALRNQLRIENWLVFGGSWGSTLALAYAITHPSRTLGLILRGIFLCRPSEIHWFYQEGASQIFPDYWDEFLKPVPPIERNQLMKAYAKMLSDSNYETRLKAAKAWSKWEAATSRLFVDPKAVDEFDNAEFAIAFASIECHYFMNNAFFETDNWLLENISKIRHLPCYIVQGRYDVVCPARSAWDLHKAWPEAKLAIIPDSGHAAGEISTRAALIEATEACKGL
jgi:proline iminopeptidase